MLFKRNTYWRKRAEEAERQEKQWRDIATKFVDACDIDGFGHVRSAHLRDLTHAWTEYRKHTNG